MSEVVQNQALSSNILSEFVYGRVIVNSYKMPSRDYVEDQELIYQSMSVEEVVNRFRNPVSPMLLLDCRPQADFAASHIRGALNMTLPASLIMLRRLANGKLNVSSLISDPDSKEQFLKLWKDASLVLYDSDSDTRDNNKVFSTLLQRLHNEGCKVVCLQGGFDNFQSLYPEWCESESSEASLLGLMTLHISSINTDVRQPDSGLSDCSVSTPPFPVEILPHLYLGNASDSCDWDALERYGIHYILNVTPNLPNTFKTELGMKYMQIPIQDHWSQNLFNFFPQAIDFIDEARKRKLGVLVHCLAGISRSVTITLAYLMHELNIPLNEAYDFVQRRKANISPNLNFLGQLKDFERQLNLSTCHCSNSPYPCEHLSSSIGSTPDSAVHTEMWT